MKAAGSLPVLAISRREERFDDPRHHNRFDIGLIVLLLRIEQIAIVPTVEDLLTECGGKWSADDL